MKAPLHEPRISKEASIFGTTPTKVYYDSSTLHDYKLAYEAFLNFLFLADTFEILVDPLNEEEKSSRLLCLNKPRS